MVAAAILAGGRGRRLGGASKPLLVVGGQRIIDRQLAVLRPLFDAVVLIAADTHQFADAALDVEIVPDRSGPGLGPLAGLDSALAWLPPAFDSLVCVAGDMPFLADAVLRRLRDAPPTAAIVPRIGGIPQTLCARYDRALAPIVAAEIGAGTRAMHIFLERLDQTSAIGVRPGSGAAAQHGRIVWLDEPELRRLDPDLTTFTNINTPDDANRANR